MECFLLLEGRAKSYSLASIPVRGKKGTEQSRCLDIPVVETKGSPRIRSANPRPLRRLPAPCALRWQTLRVSAATRPVGFDSRARGTKKRPRPSGTSYITCGGDEGKSAHSLRESATAAAPPGALRAPLANAPRFRSYAPCRVRFPCAGNKKEAPPKRNLLHYLWWRRRESNPRPLPCDGSALPAELRPQAKEYSTEKSPSVKCVFRAIVTRTIVQHQRA